jgi:hypothetical protein
MGSLPLKPLWFLLTYWLLPVTGVLVYLLTRDRTLMALGVVLSASGIALQLWWIATAARSVAATGLVGMSVAAAALAGTALTLKVAAGVAVVTGQPVPPAFDPLVGSGLIDALFFAGFGGCLWLAASGLGDAEASRGLPATPLPKTLMQMFFLGLAASYVYARLRAALPRSASV